MKPWAKAVYQVRRSTDAASQLEAILYCGRLTIRLPDDLIKYHDALLFTVANPFNRTNMLLAQQELLRLCGILKKKQAFKSWQRPLEGSGLPFTVLRCQFSADLASWFLHYFPEQVRPDEAHAEPSWMASLTQAMFPGIEFNQTTQGSGKAWSRIQALSGHNKNGYALQWLIQSISRQGWNPVLNDMLYDSLKIFIRWNLDMPEYTRTWLRCPGATMHYRKQIFNRADSRSILNTTVGKPVPLNETEKEKLLTVAKLSLALYFRETDPVTFAQVKETELYNMGNGLMISTMSMKDDRKLALETYVGFMAFRNGVPIAYGGGWMLGYRCKIGVNIYPPFRGAGSDQIFCEVLRLYHQVFEVNRFVVKPYQFGKGNPEGLKTGAFWFYYRLGFRPVKMDIRELAEKEWAKIQADKLYRTPMPLLKKFTSCNKEWEPVESPVPLADADHLSIAVTGMIVKKFKADRLEAIRICRSQLNKIIDLSGFDTKQPNTKKVIDNWSLLMALIPDASFWPLRDKQLLNSILLARVSGDDKVYMRRIRQHRKLMDAFAALK